MTALNKKNPMSLALSSCRKSWKGLKQPLKCTNICSSSEKCLLSCCVTERWHVWSRSHLYPLNVPCTGRNFIQVQESSLEWEQHKHQSPWTVSPRGEGRFKTFAIHVWASLPCPQAPCSAAIPIKQMQLLKLGMLMAMHRAGPFLGIRNTLRGRDWGGTGAQTLPRAGGAPAAGTGCSVPQGGSGRDAVTCEEEDAAGLGLCFSFRTSSDFLNWWISIFLVSWAAHSSAPGAWGSAQAGKPSCGNLRGTLLLFAKV